MKTNATQMAQCYEHRGGLPSRLLGTLAERISFAQALHSTKANLSDKVQNFS